MWELSNPATGQKARPVGNGNKNALQSLEKTPLWRVKVNIKNDTVTDTIVSITASVMYSFKFKDTMINF